MKIKFIPNDVEFEIKPNESVLKVAQDHGIHIKSVCKGVPSCAECRIQVAEGEYNVFPPLPAEVNLIGSAHFVDRSRLACQLKCFGDVTIDLKEQIEKANRNLASKRPRGGRGADGDDYDPGASSAVQGSIILDEKDVFKDIAKEAEQNQKKPQRPERPNARGQEQRPGQRHEQRQRPDNNPDRNRNKRR